MKKSKNKLTVGEIKLLRRNSVHPTTLKERQTRFQEALVGQYRANEGLGSRKRKLRQLKKENPKGYKALLLDNETDSKGC